MIYDELMGRHEIKPWLGIIPGLNWLDHHEHDLDDYQPRFETSGPGFKHSMSIKPGHYKVVSRVMRINKRKR